MTRAGMARPVVIPKKRQLGPGVVLSNCHTLGISQEYFHQLLDEI